MEVSALCQSHPEVLRIINSITSTPAPDNPCLAFWVAQNITAANARAFARRIIDIDRDFVTAYLDAGARQAKRESARAALAAHLDVPPQWQIDRIFVLQKPTSEYPTAFSLVQVHSLISLLEDKRISKARIVDVFAELVSTAFIPYSPVDSSAPPLVDLVSPITGDKKTELPQPVQDVHEELQEKVAPTAPPRKLVSPPPAPQPAPPRQPSPPRPAPPHQPQKRLRLLPIMADFATALTAAFPRFSGKGDEDFDTYIARLENTFRLIQIPDDAKKSTFIYTLDGIAFQAANRLSQQDPDVDYEQLKTAVQAAFRKPTDKHSALQKLTSRIMEDGEDLRFYVQSVIQLCTAYDKNMPEELRVEYIQHGLPTSIQSDLLTESFKTVDDLVKKVDLIQTKRARLRQAEAVRALVSGQRAITLAAPPAPAPAPVVASVAAAPPPPLPAAAAAELADMRSSIEKLQTAVTTLTAPATRDASVSNLNQDNSRGQSTRGRGQGRRRRGRGRGQGGDDRGRGQGGDDRGRRDDSWSHDGRGQDNNYRSNNTGFGPFGRGPRDTDRAIVAIARHLSTLSEQVSRLTVNHPQPQRATFPQVNSVPALTAPAAPAPFCSFCSEPGHTAQNCVAMSF
ncbi:Zinc finger CCHC domain-containing protein 12 [Frankliniella fusca]|uniref:Zinc finger CCHC domain-containing protein 12 n=1 Tax=Frankliniella fusca TaxID=407009 RepID=A0AAE1LE17_9NEOP|nr:Zinc finger CCHC domain-containing protein 12 [Frankliniella fusca]